MIKNFFFCYFISFDWIEILNQSSFKLVLFVQSELDDWKASALSEDTENRLKGLVKDWERRIAVKDAEHTQVS